MSRPYKNGERDAAIYTDYQKGVKIVVVALRYRVHKTTVYGIVKRIARGRGETLRNPLKR